MFQSKAGCIDAPASIQSKTGCIDLFVASHLCARLSLDTMPSVHRLSSVWKAGYICVSVSPYILNKKR